MEQLPFFSVLGQLQRDREAFEAERGQMRAYLRAVETTRDELKRAIAAERALEAEASAAAKAHADGEARFLSGLDFVQGSLPDLLDDVRAFGRRNAQTRERMSDAHALMERGREEKETLEARRQELEAELARRTRMPRDYQRAEQALKDLEASPTPLALWAEELDALRRRRYPERRRAQGPRSSPPPSLSQAAGAADAGAADAGAADAGAADSGAEDAGPADSPETGGDGTDDEGAASAWDSEEFVEERGDPRFFSLVLEAAAASKNSRAGAPRIVSKKRKARLREGMRRTRAILRRAAGLDDDGDAAGDDELSKAQKRARKLRQRSETLEAMLLVAEAVSPHAPRPRGGAAFSASTLSRRFGEATEEWGTGKKPPGNERLAFNTRFAAHFSEDSAGDEHADGALGELFDLLDASARGPLAGGGDAGTGRGSGGAALLHAQLSRPVERATGIDFTVGFASRWQEQEEEDGEKKEKEEEEKSSVAGGEEVEEKEKEKKEGSDVAVVGGGGIE
jgi:hypothetical protein